MNVYKLIVLVTFCAVAVGGLDLARCVIRHACLSDDDGEKFGFSVLGLLILAFVIAILIGAYHASLSP